MWEAFFESGGRGPGGYTNAQLTTSTTMIAFSDYRWCHTVAEQGCAVKSCREYGHYLERYCTKKDLWSYINFESKVAHVKWLEEEQKFEVEVEGKFTKRTPSEYEGHDDLEVDEHFSQTIPQLQALTSSSTTATYKVDRLVIASGGNQIPVTPTWPGQETFKGPIIHSVQYKGNEQFKGKRVVCVGAGESGSDITFMISQAAAQTYLCIRKNAGFVIPRYALGQPTDLDTCRMRHSICQEINEPFIMFRAAKMMPRFVKQGRLPGYWNKVSEMNVKLLSDLKAEGGHPYGFFGTKSEGIARATYENGAIIKKGISCIKENSVVFDDGEEVECDAIVLNTGYKTQLPYMEKYCSELLDPVRTACGGGIDVRRLYKQVFHPQMGGKLMWVGFARPALGAVPVLAEMQARFVAMVCSGEVELPDCDTQTKLAEADRAFYHHVFGPHAERIKSLVLHLTYTDSIASIIGCEPHLFKLFFTNPRAWIGAQYGCIGCTQYRLNGPYARRKYVLKTLSECQINLPASIVLNTLFAIVSYFLYLIGWTTWRPSGQVGGINAPKYRPNFMEHAKIPDWKKEREEHALKSAAKQSS